METAIEIAEHTATKTSSLEDLVLSWKFQFGVAVGSLVLSLTIHWCRMRRTRIRADAGGRYKPVGGIGGDDGAELAEIPGGPDDDEVDAEYGETGADMDDNNVTTTIRATPQ